MVAQWKIINENYKNLEGYKRVAWPPASEERIIREFTPQPQTQSPAPGSGGYYPQGHAPTAAAAAPPQGPIYNNVQPRTTQPPQNAYPTAPLPTSTAYSTNQYPDVYPQQEQQQQQPVQYTQAQFSRQRSREPVQVPAPSPAPASDPSGYPYQNYLSNYPQEPLQAANNVGGGWKHIGAPQPKSRSEFTAGQGAYPPFQGSYQQQPQQQQQQQQYPGAYAGQDSYRGASPGIITLRKEAPVSQQPAPVYTSQPAAVSYQGGSKLRGDLKWPPPEYKEAAARENEERRQLALGPVCRPRRVNRDYTPFFAKHQLNNGYPSYKVPPGTQHMFG
ncbi:uncharacterized protein Dere_GG15415, isoform D [Drosophila erecta]|uniref:Uncharacterized protein, isoform D n=1 Tax=Drosophila erecta TaxID=7220 RepID=A0A0Q5UEW2_DROER|nr:uncharacterized protein Dere_GG15415, isoform D [Drosophila erecta]